MSNVSGSFPNPPVPDLDEESLMIPPWVKYPNIPKGSVGWRMGIGEEYCHILFPTWWSRQTRKVRLRVREKYPEPAGWSDFYANMA